MMELYAAVLEKTTKGQLVSEWLFGAFNFPKKKTEKFDEFLP